jgi:hypothetical protein
MKIMLTEDQFDEVVELESYKKNFFKYWDKFGAKYNDQMLKLFGLSRGTIPSSLVSRWLREYLGTSSKEILTNFFNKTVHKIDNCGGYDFTFTIDNYRRDGHQFEITITVDDINGSVDLIMTGGGEHKLRDAINNEDYGWEVENEIEDCIYDYFIEKIENTTGFSFVIERIKYQSFR